MPHQRRRARRARRAMRARQARWGGPLSTTAQREDCSSDHSLQMRESAPGDLAGNVQLLGENARVDGLHPARLSIRRPRLKQEAGGREDAVRVIWAHREMERCQQKKHNKVRGKQRIARTSQQTSMYTCQRITTAQVPRIAVCFVQTTRSETASVAPPNLIRDPLAERDPCQLSPASRRPCH